MVRSLSVLLFLLAPIAILSGAEELFFEGNARFAEGNYAEAAGFYEQALEKTSSANLYFNSGLAALKLGEPGKARLQWERALVLDPRHSQARKSLEKLLSEFNLPGKNSESAGSLKNRFYVLVGKFFSMNQSIWATVFSLWLVLFAALGFWWKRLKVFPWLAFAGLVGGVFSMTVVFHLNEEREVAIVLEDGAELWVAPVPHSPVAGSLRAGERVKILDSRSEFFHIRRENGSEGYLKAATIEPVF